jgi:ATP-dependent Clp protease protease subunit
MKNQFLTTALIGLLSGQIGAAPIPVPANTKHVASTAEVAKPKKTYKTDIVLTDSNTIVFRDVFMENTVAVATVKAREFDAKLPKDAVIYLIINSPGGDIDAGIEFIENMNSLNHKVVTLTQFSASMGFQTVQGVNGERLILANGTLMSHKAKGGFSGEFGPNGGQMNTRFEYYLKRVKRLDERAVQRTNGKMDLKQYEELIRDEYWCDGQDCVNKGFADKVVTATCDDSLSGTQNLAVSLPFMGMMIQAKAEVAKCPLITGPLGIEAGMKFYVDGKEYTSDTFNDIKSEKLKQYILAEFEKATDKLSQIAAGTYRNAERY